MSEQMDELVEKAAVCPQTVFPDGTRCGEQSWHAQDCPIRQTRAILEAAGLPALLERLEAAEAGGHRLNEYGTTDCPVEHVRANVDDGECSACGASVGPMVADPLARMSEAFKREHRWRMEVTAERDALAAKVADAGEQIARAIQEAKPDHMTRDYTPVDQAYDNAAAIARAALTEDPTNKEN